MDKKLVTYPKEEKIQLSLGVRGAKAAALFSIFGTDKQILFAKHKYSNFKIIVWLNSMHNTVETVDRLCQEESTFVRALR